MRAAGVSSRPFPGTSSASSSRNRAEGAGRPELGLSRRRRQRSDIATLIMNYHPTIWEKWSSSLADIFITYSNLEQGGDTPRK